MNYACLIPITRPSLAINAIKSAENDGWLVFTESDDNHEGANIIRERLLDSVLKYNDIDGICYLDDDDILLPSKKLIKLNDYDVVYTDHETHYLDRGGVCITSHYSGNFYKDARHIAPWSWIATPQALCKVKDMFGYVWDKDISCAHGQNCWLNFIKANLKIGYLPINHYRFTQYNDLTRISYSQKYDDEYQIVKRKLYLIGKEKGLIHNSKTNRTNYL